MKVLAVVIARGGSKGLPHKNTLACAGKPLVWWSLNATCNSFLINKIILSTDDDEIAAIGRQFPRVEVQMRPQHLAQDEIPGPEVVNFIYKQELAKGYKYDFTVMVLGCVPTVIGFDFDKAIAFLNNRPEADGITGSVPVLWQEYSHTVDDQGFIHFHAPERITRTGAKQDYPPSYLPNGAIYISRGEFPTSGFWTNRKILPYIMNPQDSADVDSQYDLDFAEWLLNRRGPDTRFDNIYRGKRAWVIGTGPSLARITPQQWTEIDKDITIGVNNLAAYHEPKFLVSGEVENVNFFESFRKSPAKKFVCEGPQAELGCEAERFSHTNQPTYKLSQGLCLGGSSSIAALNLALIMGCNPVVLLGIDYHNHTHIIPQFNDDPEKPYCYPHDITLAFDTFKKFVFHAKTIGRTIINANLDSAIDCFPKKPIDEILANGRPC